MITKDHRGLDQAHPASNQPGHTPDINDDDDGDDSGGLGGSDAADDDHLGGHDDWNKIVTLPVTGQSQ